MNMFQHLVNIINTNILQTVVKHTDLKNKYLSVESL